MISFDYPLCSVESHPTTSKELLVSDSRGSLFLLDWRRDPNDPYDGSLYHENTIELTNVKVTAAMATNLSKAITGSASWRRDEPTM